MKIRKTKLKTIIPILLILIIAAYFRLYYMDLIEFKTDEARDAMILLNIVKEKELPLLGAPFSAGGRSGPIFYYLLAIPYFIMQDPRASSFFVGFLNLLGVYVLYRIGKDFFSEKTGLIASALFAVSPYAVIYSRKIWNSNMLLPFVILFFYFLLAYINKKKPKYLFASAVPLAFTMQIHPTSVVLLFILMASYFVFKFKTQIRDIIIFAAIILLIFSPFIYYEFTHNFENTKAFLNYGNKVATRQLNSDVWLHFMSTTTGLNFDYFLGSSSQSFYSQLPEFIGKIFTIEFLAVLVGWILIVKRIARGNKLQNDYLVLAMWFFISLIVLALYTGGLYPHHLVIIIPVSFLAAGILIESIISSKRKLAKYFGLALLFAIVITQFVFVQTFFSFIQKNGGAAGDYDVVYKDKFEAVNFVVKDSGSNSFKATNFLDRNELNLEYQYIFSELGKSPSSNANQEYLILNTFTTHLNSTEVNYLSAFPVFTFGPMKVYRLPFPNLYQTTFS